jgi:hypothetical protein
MRTEKIPPVRPPKKSSFPSGDQSGSIEAVGIWYVAPVLGNGCTKIPGFSTPPLVYASHRPSGENTELVGIDDWTSPNGAAFLS